MALSSRPSLWEFTRLVWEQCQVAVNPLTKSTDWSCESGCTLLFSTLTVTTNTQPHSDAFLTIGWLSWPRHCSSKGAQPVPRLYITGVLWRAHKLPTAGIDLGILVHHSQACKHFTTACWWTLSCGHSFFYFQRGKLFRRHGLALNSA